MRRIVVATELPQLMIAAELKAAGNRRRLRNGAR